MGYISSQLINPFGLSEPLNPSYENYSVLLKLNLPNCAALRTSVNVYAALFSHGVWLLPSRPRLGKT